MDQILENLGVAGAFSFAISGALTAMNKKLDPFGVLIVAFATAVGGGTLRDVLVSSNSAFWLTEPKYAYFIIGGTIFAILFRKKLFYLKNTLMLFDTLGLALFTIVGLEIGIQHELSGLSCVALGTITGAFGGVLRDILVRDVPVIFRKEIYATISIFGGILYLLLNKLNAHYVVLDLIPITVIIALRLLVVYFKISLPSIYKNDDNDEPRQEHVVF